MPIRERSRSVIEEIKQLYKADSRPWVIGYSGGKDSTTVVQLVFNAMTELSNEEHHKPIYVISSDTLVETPLIIDYINSNLNKIQERSLELGLPISTHKVKPEIDKTFWVTLIGKGYPSPRQKFRWCTDKLKIDPANRFIIDTVNEYGEVIMVLGVRLNESASRDQVLNSHRVEGKLLRTHSTLNKAYVYAPIEQFSTDDVWEYLLTFDSPWESDNHELLQLYQDSLGECPLVVDKSTPSCGNSRFGCWVCTVVSEDKALKGFIESGERWLIPLLRFRNYLMGIRNDREKRQKRRRDGNVYWVTNADGEKVQGLGPFTLETRQEILRELLETQKKIESQYRKLYSLIQKEELIKIRELWIEDGDWQDTLLTIYEEVIGEPLMKNLTNQPIFTYEEIAALTRFCEDENVSFDLLWKLINMEAKYYGYKYRHGILDEIDKILHEEWLHIDIESGVFDDN